MGVKFELTFNKIRDIEIKLASSCTTIPFPHMLVDRAQKFLEINKVLIAVAQNTYPYLNNSKEDTIFRQFLGLIICCFEETTSLKTAVDEIELSKYFENLLMDNIYQKARILFDENSGYNQFRISSKQKNLLDYNSLLINRELRAELPDMETRYKLILSLHIFINILNEFYFE